MRSQRIESEQASIRQFDVKSNPIANNPLGIKKVDAVKITYTALNVGGAPVTVSGGLAIPEMDASSIKGMVLFFHGTTTERTNVPSNFITENGPEGNTNGVVLAALWASQGYVVVMPDFIGLGADTKNPHPYVIYPQENAQSGLAMLKAARSYLGTRIPRHLPLFTMGYSEGGAYALEAGHLMENNRRYEKLLKLSLTEAVPVSGVFDLTGTMLRYLFFNISASANPWFSLDPSTSALSKPYLSAYLALSFSHYDEVSPTDVMVTPFYECSEGVAPMCGSTGNIDGLFFESGVPDATVILNMVRQASQTAWMSSNNSVEPLLTPAYVKALMNADMTNPLYQQLLKADSYKFVPDFPVALVSLVQDSVVTPVNTHVAFSYFSKQKPGGQIQEILVDNADFIVPGLFGNADVDHTSELPFLAVVALNQFNLGL